MAILSVLLVDDKPGDVRLVVEAFKESRVQNNLSIVGDGEEAISFLKQEGKYQNAPRPNLVLLDLRLPGLNGLEVLKQIKGNEKISGIPVIVLSNSDSEADINSAYKYMANCYIVKPFAMAEFIEVVKYMEKFWMNCVRLPGQKL
ncbi:MAG: response regulator [Candidatus Goldbacteria bacterium]|nr:response regulator [Candidatus Goldiibacteriota bacterium]